MKLDLDTVGNCLFYLFFFFNIFFFWPFSGFIDRIAEECDRKQGKRGGVTRSKGTQAESNLGQPRHMGRALPTKLSGAPMATVSAGI